MGVGNPTDMVGFPWESHNGIAVAFNWANWMGIEMVLGGNDPGNGNDFVGMGGNGNSY